MTVFKTSLPRSEAYWGITKKSGIIDRHYLGLYKGVLAYPNKYCSYTVYSHIFFIFQCVREIASLSSAWFILSVAEVSVPEFAVSLPSVHVSQQLSEAISWAIANKPPCDLLILQGVTLVYKRFAPSGKINTRFVCY